MNKQIIVIGAGGHATVIVEILKMLNCNILAIVSNELVKRDIPLLSDIPRLSCDADILNYDYNQVVLVNGIGSIPGKLVRQNIHVHFKNLGYEFMTVVSPLALVSKHSKLESGVQILHGAIVNANSSIGEGSIVNSGAIVEHDCILGRHNHIAPGATVCGSVTTGDFVHIGAGSNVIQSVVIGNSVLVGAGSTVVSDLPDNAKHYSARPFII